MLFALIKQEKAIRGVGGGGVTHSIAAKEGASALVLFWPVTCLPPSTHGGFQAFFLLFSLCSSLLPLAPARGTSGEPFFFFSLFFSSSHKKRQYGRRCGENRAGALRSPEFCAFLGV